MAQLLKKLPARADARDARDSGSIPGSEDPLEKEVTTHSSILAWRIHVDRGARRATAHGVTRSRTRLSTRARTLPAWELDAGNALAFRGREVPQARWQRRTRAGLSWTGVCT